MLGVAGFHDEPCRTLFSSGKYLAGNLLVFSEIY
jgi:hypothetical protein